jgi:MoaA/NifB/PqqE/SkfB family radical SAM enzyme
MRPIEIPASHNYIAVFLSLSCNYKCSYCINYYAGGKLARRHLGGKDWVEGINRIVTRPDLPVTLQGGEPSIHKDFIFIVNNIKKEIPIDILTNLQFDVVAFKAQVDPNKIKREAPYASIRVSYHPEQMDLDELIKKTLYLQEANFSIGLFGVMHPSQRETILAAQERCKKLGIDFRVKEFLGEYQGKYYGTFRYPDAIRMEDKKNCLCKTTELIVGPNGAIYRCHGDLYEDRMPIGNILDDSFQIENIYRPCDQFGYCNPCDIKIKTNRFQQYGHTSVEIKEIRG